MWINGASLAVGSDGVVKNVVGSRLGSRLACLLLLSISACTLNGRIPVSGRIPGPGEPPKFSEFCPSPEQTAGDWRTGQPGDAGLDRSVIESLRADIARGRLGTLHGLLVVRDGVLVVEEYFHGAGREDCQLIASVTKSLVSLLVGIALERRPDRSVSTPLAAFFPEYQAATAAWAKPAIGLEHALTMTAGLDWDETTYPHPDTRNPNTMMYRAQDPVRFILERKTVRPPGTEWDYNSGLSVLLGEVVRDLTGSYIDRFAAAELFGPLGIDRYFWMKHANGTVYTNGDLLLTPRDLAKIGLLVLNGGEWQGRRIVASRWIARSTKRRVTTRREYDYGYHWWIGTAANGDRRLDVIFGSGTGGQRLFIVPELEMVVVVTAQVFGHPGGPVAAYRVLSDYLIPALLPRPAIRAEPPTPAFARSAAGRYVDPRTGHSIRIARDGATLHVKPAFFTKIALKPTAEKRFVGHWRQIGNFQADFDVDATGAVTGLTANFLLRDRTYRKID